MNKYILLVSALFLTITNYAQDWSAWGKHIEGLTKDLNTTGLSVAVVNKDGIVYKASYGYADLSENEKLSTAHIFNIASCSKAFTAASVAQLVDQGLCSWDDKVVDHLPEFDLGDDYITRNLTIRDLFCHRAGYKTFAGDLLWYGSTYTDEEVFERLKYQKMDYPFRYQFGYQNNLYTVAGLLIKKLSGMDWSTYVKSNWFDKLGMNDTYPSNDEFSGKEKIAEPHYNGQTIERYDFSSGKPAASIQSNVEDLAKWTQMWLNNGVMNGDTMLQSKTIRTLWQAHTPTPVSASQEENGTNFSAYALGWKVFDYHGLKVVEHDGGMPGYISKVTLVPSEGYAIICLNNGYDFFANSAARYTALDAIRGADDPKDWISFYADYNKRYAEYAKNRFNERDNSRIPHTLSMSLDKYIGEYTDPSYSKAAVSMKDEELYLSFEASEALFSGKLTHWHYNTFKWEHNDPFLTYGLITFDVDTYGKVIGFKVDLPNDDFHFDMLDFNRID